MNATLSLIEPLDRTVMSVAPARKEEKAAPPLPSSTCPDPQTISLPKAAPLVVPARSADAVPPPDDDLVPERSSARPAPADSAALQACLAEIAHTLTTYLGPVAGLLVKRHAANLTDLAKLVEDLAREIPAKDERLQFLTRAQQVMARRRH
jgi:predicted component of type VI protein secretion system